MNKNKITDTYTLNNGVQIPIVGLGTWQSKNGQEAYNSVLNALQIGYRHIDTAAEYGNERSVGKAIKDSGVKRTDIFVTSKLWNSNHGYEATKEALDASLSRLQLDYLDLYLIHWPNPVNMRNEWQEKNANSWRAMEEALSEGKVRAIGVSNFREHHLNALLKTASVKPTVNQIFLNPSDLQENVVKFNQQHDILSEAYSPLGTGKIFKLPQLQELSNKYHKSVAQIVLRWSLQHGFLPLPKSVHKERLVENTKLFDFNLSSDDMQIIDQLHGQAGLAADPDQVDF